MGLYEILDKYRAESDSKRELGDKFEDLMVRYLMTDPTYSSIVDWAVTWTNFFAKDEFGKQDTGIDIVAKTVDGEYWAVQCKCYAEGYQVSKSDIDTFLSISGKKFHNSDGSEVTFSSRVIFATTNNWSSHALDSQEGQIIPVTLVGLRELEESQVDWDQLESGEKGEVARLAKHTLKPHQKEALDKAIEHYSANDRGKMIMACGTGKTFTSLRIAETLVPHNGCILFLAPSIALVGQTLREWMAHTERDIKPICVCSDMYVSKKKSKDDSEMVENLAVPATTDPYKIGKNYDPSKLNVVFSTYQSIDAVMGAQGLGFPDFDLIICDEAHRTTGVTISGQDESNFVRVHSNTNIRGSKRLYMTATPRVYGDNGKKAAKEASAVVCSMDDVEKYGKEFYHISFGQAVEKELLSDYKVLILTIKGNDIPENVKHRWSPTQKEIDADMDTLVWGCLNALSKNLAYDETLKNTDPENMKSALIFSRTIKRSEDIAARFNSLASLPNSPIKASVKHIDGSMNALERDELLSWMKEGDVEGCHALSNVRCLCEGVDVPALDAVMFMDSKGSLVDVVQSVGRVMRRAPGKKYGYIIIPILVPGDEDAEEALNSNDRYKVVWQVLRALRSHDERLDAEINTFNLRESNSGGHIHIAGPEHGGTNGDGGDTIPLTKAQYNLDEFGGKLFAKLVLKVGDREYIENWAKDVANVMPVLMERLKEICTGDYYDDEIFNDTFKLYHSSLMMCVNEDLSEEDAVKMLAQQIVTKPIFDTLFGGEGFVMDNSVSRAIDRMLKAINARDGLADIGEQLKDFHTSVERTLSRIDTAEGKQKVITALYEKFFKNAFPKDQAINGVVYTPIEIVDFILRSAADILKQEFGKDINDEGVNIMDPFTGTGTFIARLMESGLIAPENLERKYKSELFANEITLLAYYIATINIENTYSRLTGSNEYVPFENILLTDTFNIEEICKRFGPASQKKVTLEDFFYKNRDIIRKENDAPITLIIGNPPYGANQKSANDNAKKRKYQSGIDLRISEKYLDDSLFHDKKGNVNSVYDNYIRAFRWATDRLRNENGIIAFVTPNGWLTGSAFEGFRKTIESEFSKIFIFDLRGDQNSGDWKKQGEKVFGEGSKVGISITLLVKHKGISEKAKIQYIKVPDYQKRIEKLNLLKEYSSFANISEKSYISINPKPNGDWIIERNEHFQKLLPLNGTKKFDKFKNDSIFVGYSRGYGTSRDIWMYNYSKDILESNMSHLLNEYERQTELGIIEYNLQKISWNSSLIEDSQNKKKHVFNEKFIKKSIFRPYCKQYLYEDVDLIYETAAMPRIYTNDVSNLTICVSGVGVKKDFSCIMTNCSTDLEIVGKSQCFPLYWYDVHQSKINNSKQTKLFESNDEKIIRHDGISDYALKIVSKNYGAQNITKEDIFFYVYGYLHSPGYRSTFSNDLKFSLPKIDFVDSYEDFKIFSDAGRKLSDLHTGYEDVEPYMDVKINGEVDISKILSHVDLHRVTKMKLIPESHKLIYNEYITIENIPQEAFEYIVNGRSAIGWLVDQYQVSTDKESGIVNDPNEYAGGTYILKLVLSVINVSVKTMEIVRSLPHLSFTGEGKNDE